MFVRLIIDVYKLYILFYGIRGKLEDLLPDGAHTMDPRNTRGATGVLLVYFAPVSDRGITPVEVGFPKVKRLRLCYYNFTFMTKITK